MDGARQTADVATAPSILYRHHGRHRLFLGCAVAGVVVAAGAVAAIGAYFWSYHRHADGPAFCCPHMMQELASYVNTSIKPCKDFFAYVCSSFISDKRTEGSDTASHLAQSMITGAVAENKPMGKARSFLTSYYRSCVETLPHVETFFRSLASALVRHACKKMGALHPMTALVYIFTASIKYQMPSAILANFKRSTATIYLKIETICEDDDYLLGSMTAVMDALNDRASVSISPEVALGYRREICAGLSAFKREKRKYVIKSDKPAFEKEVWSTEDVDAGLRECGYSLQDTAVIDVIGVHEILLLHDQLDLAKANSTASLLGTAFLVWHSVVSGMKAFQSAPMTSMQTIFDACLEGVILFYELWYTFAAELFTSRDKDAEARAVFAAVKRAVHADCEASRLFDAEDSEQLHSFFNDLVVVTPTEASQVAVTVPNATTDFGESLLRGCLYDFEVIKQRDGNLNNVQKVEYQDVLFLGNSRLLLSASVYDFINVSSGKHDLVNNAFLGRLLAESMWYMALTSIQWKSKTLTNIDRFKTCLAENSPGGNKIEASDDVVVAVLGLSSVLNVLSKTDWYTVRPAWSLWRISDAQFYFMLSTFYRCPRQFSSDIALLINASLLYSEDFANAFECTTSEPMLRTRDCFFQTLSRD